MGVVWRVRITATPGSVLILTAATSGRVGHPSYERRGGRNWVKAGGHVGHARAKARRAIILDAERSARIPLSGELEGPCCYRSRQSGDCAKGGLTLNSENAPTAL